MARLQTRHLTHVYTARNPTDYKQQRDPSSRHLIYRSENEVCLLHVDGNATAVTSHTDCEACMYICRHVWVGGCESMGCGVGEMGERTAGEVWA